MPLGARVVLLTTLLSAACFGQQLESQEALEPVEGVIAKLPACALPCLTAAVLKSNCSATDMQCICSNTMIQTDARQCLLTSCSVPEVLATTNITLTGCNAPVRDKATTYCILTATVASITTVLVITRLIFKRFFSRAKALTLDDIFIIATLILHISCSVTNVVGLGHSGAGRDVWTLTPEELKRFAYYFYVLDIHFFAEISLAKLTLLLFYLSIFPDEFIRRLLWGTVVFVGLFGLTSTIVAVFVCTPVNYFWNQYSTNATGHCVNLNAFAWSHAAINVASDIWMIGLPLSQIRTLRLHWKKKLAASFMFLTGLFVTIAAILRMQSLVHFNNSNNPTWDQIIVAVWAIIETNLSIICVCLPTLRLMLVRLFPRILSSETKQSQPNYGPEQIKFCDKHWIGGFPLSEPKLPNGRALSLKDSAST